MSEDTIRIGLTGTVMLGRTVDFTIPPKAYAWPWGDVLPLMRRQDLNFANLETTLTTSTRKHQKTFTFKAHPDKVNCLLEANIRAVTLANNHMLDFSEEGLRETIAVLDTAGIRHVGAGMNDKAAQAPLILPVNNIRLGILSLTNDESSWKAGPGHPGVNYVDLYDGAAQQLLLDNIVRLRQHVDHVLVSIRWGSNMQEEPNPLFIELAHEIIDHGASIIHGHGAHIFQGVEVYRNKLILYDTGDFIDDYAVDQVLRNDRSFFYIVEADRTSIPRLELIPVLIADGHVGLATENDRIEAIRRMKDLSSALGTRIDSHPHMPDPDAFLQYTVNPSPCG
ncbi:MAG TPA: CapA family protein [Puia sp.]|uniref:CapA family protein n=1 Tax=Puia sp. TaxID=2045100 RepID=UPI002B9FC750|nr:CapA family protein [Puia sp.]HVU98458.1 CapA family protein [Puia sp.]